MKVSVNSSNGSYVELAGKPAKEKAVKVVIWMTKAQAANLGDYWDDSLEDVVVGAVAKHLKDRRVAGAWMRPVHEYATDEDV